MKIEDLEKNLNDTVEEINHLRFEIILLKTKQIEIENILVGLVKIKDELKEKIQIKRINERR